MLVPFALIFVGLAISIGALSSQTVTEYATSYAGAIAPGTATLVLPAVGAGYLQINLTEGGCGLRLYPSTDAEWVLFNQTGTLPLSWLDCTTRATTTKGDVRALILVEGGSSAERYNVTVFAYSIETPYGWVALPGTGLALAGLLLLIPRLAFGGAARLRNGYAGKKGK